MNIDKKLLGTHLLIGLCILFLFHGIFKSFQNPSFYNSTLGLISKNYEHITDKDGSRIIESSKPFVYITNDNMHTWDANIYFCIKKRLYSTVPGCYNNVRAAFFPLFSIIWKFLGVSTITISILNYLIFISSIAILIQLLYKNSKPNKTTLFLFSVTLPSIVIFHIPYTESVFIGCSTLMIAGIIKGKYWWFAIGIFLMSLTRVASIFVLIAIVVIEVNSLMRNRSLFDFGKSLLLKLFPFLIGYLLVLFLQYLYSGSWTIFWEAHNRWKGGFQLPKQIVDWSVEGFGVSVVSLFFICIPAFALSIYMLLKSSKEPKQNIFKENHKEKTKYLLLLSALYLGGMFLFKLFYSGGNLHSFFRFTMGSPFFYVFLYLLLPKLHKKGIWHRCLLYTIPGLSLVIFMTLVTYGGERWKFQFAGMYLYGISLVFYLFNDKIEQRLRLGVLCTICLFNLVWNTYLLNAYLCDGWIYL